MKTKFEFRGAERSWRFAIIAPAAVLILGLLLQVDGPLPRKELIGSAIGFLTLSVAGALWGLSRMVEIDIRDRRIKVTWLWFGLRVRTIVDVNCDECEAILIRHRAAVIAPRRVHWPRTIAFLVLKSGRRYRMPIFHEGDGWIVAQKLAAGLGELTGLPLVFDPPELAGSANPPLIEPLSLWPYRRK